MQAVLFTKLFRGQRLGDVAAAASGLGFDGIDLLIRPGHQVEPGAPERIGDAVRLLEAGGLAVPMATTDLTDPAEAPTERLLAACAEAGIGLVRLGYWKYDANRGYAASLDEARRHLDELERLAERAGVRLAVQLHGGTIHGSGAQTVALLADHDPASLGAYPDPGNQVVQDGREDWRFTFDVLRPWLCCVGVKNGGWFPAELAPSGGRGWRSDWLGLPDGMVPWDDILAHLVGSGYAGPLSFHSHYEVPLPQALEQTRLDLGFVRRRIEAHGPVPAPSPRA
jgi:sugar phosphate isomerase/epimerase